MRISKKYDDGMILISQLRRSTIAADAGDEEITMISAYFRQREWKYFDIHEELTKDISIYIRQMIAISANARNAIAEWQKQKSYNYHNFSLVVI